MKVDFGRNTLMLFLAFVLVIINGQTLQTLRASDGSTTAGGTGGSYYNHEDSSGISEIRAWMGGTAIDTLYVVWFSGRTATIGKSSRLTETPNSRIVFSTGEKITGSIYACRDTTWPYVSCLQFSTTLGKSFSACDSAITSCRFFSATASSFTLTGFFGRAGDALDQIGFYTRIPATTTPAPTTTAMPVTSPAPATTQFVYEATTAATTEQSPEDEEDEDEDRNNEEDSNDDEDDSDSSSKTRRAVAVGVSGTLAFASAAGVVICYKRFQQKPARAPVSIVHAKPVQHLNAKPLAETGEREFAPKTDDLETIPPPAYTSDPVLD